MCRLVDTPFFYKQDSNDDNLKAGVYFMATNYNVFVSRAVNAAKTHEFHGVVLEGDGKFFGYCERAGVSDCARLAYMQAFASAVTRVRQLLEYKELPTGHIIFYTTKTIFSRYLGYFLNEEWCTKPPKKYFDFVYKIYTELEALPCTYEVQFAEWANNANKVATETYWASQKGTSKGENAAEAFRNMGIED